MLRVRNDDPSLLPNILLVYRPPTAYVQLTDQQRTTVRNTRTPGLTYARSIRPVRPCI